MITLYHVYYEIHDEVSNNDKVHNRFIKLSIIILFAAKFLDLNFLFISKILVFLDYILSLAKARDKIKSKKTFKGFTQQETEMIL